MGDLCTKRNRVHNRKTLEAEEAGPAEGEPAPEVPVVMVATGIVLGSFSSAASNSSAQAVMMCSSFDAERPVFSQQKRPYRQGKN